MGMPRGLAEQFVQSARDFSYRFWIIDNSGSMGTNDGHRVVDGAGGRQGLVPCSRWEELGERDRLARSISGGARRLDGVSIAEPAGLGRVADCGRGDW